MRYHLFLKYGWFPQNLEREAINYLLSKRSLSPSLTVLCLYLDFFQDGCVLLSYDHHISKNWPHMLKSVNINIQ